MITGFLLQIFYVLITFFFSFLPAITLPSGVTSAITTAFGFMNQFTFLFPLATLLSVVVIAISFHLALLTFDFVIWLIHLLRGR